MQDAKPGAAPASLPAPAAPTMPAGDPVAMAMGIGFALMWSSAFTSGKVALADAPPLLLLTVRFLISGLVAIGLAFALGQRLPERRIHWGLIVLLGICQNSLYLGLFFVAMTTVPAGLASIIASTMPLIVAAAGVLFFGERMRWIGAVGLALGFGGAAFIMQNRLGGDLEAYGLVLCLIGVGALAAATLVVRHADLGSGLLMVVGLQMLVGSVTLAPFGVALESFAQVTVTPSLIIAFLYTTLVPGVVATIVWFSLIRRIGAARASAFHFLNPAFGVAVAWLVLREPFGIDDLIGVAIVALGILLVQRWS